MTFAARPAPAGLRKAAAILMWVVVAAYALTTFAAFNRKSVWDDFVDGNKNLTDLDDADTLIGAGVLLAFAATLATAIVLAVWSRRTTSNAQARGAQVSPGLAAGGWFIPIGWYFVSFNQLRKAMAGRGDSSPVGWWQGLWVGGSIAGGVALRLFDDDLDQTASDVSSGLRNQSVGLLIASAVLAGATVFATRAMSNVDDATSGA